VCLLRVNFESAYFVVCLCVCFGQLVCVCVLGSWFVCVFLRGFCVGRFVCAFCGNV